MGNRRVVSPDKMLEAIADEMLYVQSRWEELRRHVQMQQQVDDLLSAELQRVSKAMDNVLDGLVDLPMSPVFSSEKKRDANKLKRWVLFG